MKILYIRAPPCSQTPCDFFYGTDPLTENPQAHLTMHPGTGPKSNSAPAEPVPGFMEYLVLRVENHFLCPLPH